MTAARKRLAWVVPESKGGIASYSRALWPAVRKACGERGWDCVEPTEDWRQLVEAAPSLIHVQHEFGLFGGKLPGRYQWPKVVRELREKIPGARLVATSHTVLAKDYLSPVNVPGRSWVGRLGRTLSNHTWVPWAARGLWTRGTWGGLDGVIVHSALQLQAILDSGCAGGVVIPHFVAATGPRGRVSRDGPARVAKVPEGEPCVGVFGYFSPEKGQDLVIEAWGRMQAKAGARVPHLILGGGVRRREDLPYERQCREQAENAGLQGRVHFTGYLSSEAMEAFFAQCALVVAPFRETSGSGSLATGFTHGAAVLASDLPLNREVAEREPGSLALFRAGDAGDLAAQVEELVAKPERLAALRAGGARYAATYSAQRIAELHAGAYERWVSGPPVRENPT